MLWLERIPLWIIGLVILVVLIVAAQLGYAVRQLMRRKGMDEPSSDGFGYLLSAALALLGLLIAFTFGEAAERFDARRLLVVDEANAIGTTYLRIQAMDDVPKAALSQLMVQYARTREGFFAAGEDLAAVRKAEARTDDLQNRIWTATVAVVRANPTATINPSVLQTTNDMFDLAASRYAAMEARMPITVLRTLLVYVVIAAALIGYGLGQGRRQIVISVTLFAVLSLAFCLILDIDRPRAGTVTVSQAPMDRAVASLESMEASKAAVVAPNPVP